FIFLELITYARDVFKAFSRLFVSHLIRKKRIFSLSIEGIHHVAKGQLMVVGPLPIKGGCGNRVVVFVLVEGIRSFASRSLIFLVLSKPIIATVDGINILLCSQIVVGIYGNVQTLGEEAFLGIFEGRHDD